MAMPADATRPTMIEIAKRKERRIRPNENKLSRGYGSEADNLRKCFSYKKLNAQRVAVGCSDWLVCASSVNRNRGFASKLAASNPPAVALECGEVFRCW